MFTEILSLMVSGALFFILHVTNTGSFPKPLSEEDEKKYLRLMKQGSKTARNKLIEHNLRLVAHIIKKYYTSANDQDDLVSIGTIGLIKAIDSFDMTKGIKLSSYSARCIENEVLMFFRNSKKTCQDVSMNDPIDTDKEGNSLSLIDIMSTDDSIIDDIDLKIKSENLKKYIENDLSLRERKIIELRYGLNGNVPKTQREVASKMNISRSYVSRIEKKALLNLKKIFKKNDKDALL